MKVTALYVGTSLLAPLRRAEAAINRAYSLDLVVAPHNCGASFSDDEWRAVETDIKQSDIVFIIHVTDEENANRIVAALGAGGAREATVIAFNCMPTLMRQTRMGRLDFGRLMGPRPAADAERGRGASGRNLARKIGSWMADTMKGRDPKGEKSKAPGSQYLKLIGRLPSVLRFLPGAGRLGDVKNYLLMFCYFLQPTPRNIESMLLYAIKRYGRGKTRIGKVEPPETLPVTGIYHPDAPALFESFADYRRWYEQARRVDYDASRAIGLLLMRPQIVSQSRNHYDGLIRAIEGEGLTPVAAISTFMDNREACREYFIEEAGGGARVSQIVSLTGFSFVGGPAMNDADAAVGFLKDLNLPFRSVISLDLQTIESWEQSRLGLNPVQVAMQVSIPEIDGATEPVVFGGIEARGNQPEPIEERCRRIARRIKRWNMLRLLPAGDVRLAMLAFCFPPNKGNIGTAADLDVFPSMLEMLRRLKFEGYSVEPPATADELRELLLKGNSDEHGQIANVAYRMSVDEYRRLCPYVDEIEGEWGRAPGAINSNGREILVLGVELGKVFIGVQPTFGYEGDPMRMLNAEGGAPHHGFMGLYTFVEKVFKADAVIHVGTHGALEFMPGKQVGLSGKCWPDRLIGEMPHVYVYSVNNPSEGTIARRRSYAELVSYLTPPVEHAGLYKELLSMKELLSAYRSADAETEREQLFEAIEEKARALNL